MITPEKIQAVRDAFDQNKSKTIRQLSREVGVAVSTVHKILDKHLKVSRCPATWVPHTLTDNQKRARVAACRCILGCITRSPTLLDRIITGDESWMFGYDPLTKRQSSQWLESGERRPQKVIRERTVFKTMLVIFWDSQGIVMRRFFPQGHGINAAHYLTVMRDLRMCIRRRQHQFWLHNNWFLHHDNTPAHRSLLVRGFLQRNHTHLLEHPPYSPDLVPSDFWFFDRIKREIRGIHFDDVDKLQRRVDAVLGSIPQWQFGRAFQCYRECLCKCIQEGGSYFEG